ncbi:aspartic peptidase domain-containing protein [Suillus paluster]|uniref:aspartic peptidase domain-containing protein n=1 Tax=Suillus paluster TaxID=48578 RepID=UPI001B86FB2B|nr:aspartic peptidase domain-containing protein [Suillus paluster]KAG1724459.1 aspartic peptidase domain-containing protein [Suillus paluster]
MFGGVDSSLFVGNITYVPVTSTYPAVLSWGINVASCFYGETIIFLTSTAGTFDTGNSLVALADDFFATCMAAIPGSYYDNQSSFIVIPSSSIGNMQPLNLTIGGAVFTMDVAAQLVPIGQDSAWDGNPGVQYGTVGPLGHQSGQGWDFILGQKFLERYYAVFDGEKKCVGLAYTSSSDSDYSMMSQSPPEREKLKLKKSLQKRVRESSDSDTNVKKPKKRTKKHKDSDSGKQQVHASTTCLSLNVQYRKGMSLQEQCLHIAHWIPQGVDMFCKLTDVFRVAPLVEQREAAEKVDHIEDEQVKNDCEAILKNISKDEEA